MAVKRCVTISFKDTKKDIALYNFIMNMDDKSGELKQILYKELINCEVEIKKQEVKKEQLLNVLNF